MLGSTVAKVSAVKETVLRRLDLPPARLEVPPWRDLKLFPNSPWYKSVFHKTHGNAARW